MICYQFKASTNGIRKMLSACIDSEARKLIYLSAGPNESPASKTSGDKNEMHLLVFLTVSIIVGGGILLAIAIEVIERIIVRRRQRQQTSHDEEEDIALHPVEYTPENPDPILEYPPAAHCPDRKPLLDEFPMFSPWQGPRRLRLSAIQEY
jgi:hypothetical protein